MGPEIKGRSSDRAAIDCHLLRVINASRLSQIMFLGTFNALCRPLPTYPVQRRQFVNGRLSC